jgi:excisionase family DNA binding protein
MAEWISVKEAAKISGYHEEHVRRIIRNRKITARKFANVAWQIDKNSLLDYMETTLKKGRKRGPKSSKSE